MSDHAIRLATPSDFASIASFNRAMALETEGKQLDPATVEQGVRALLSNPTRGFYLLAERDGAIVGQLMITFEWSDWRNGNFWWIQSVYVAPAARKTGVFHALYEEVLARARIAGDVCGLRLYVEHQNATARRTYQSVGMHEAHYDLFEVDFVFGASERD